jgi:hypothetical protein
MEGGDSVMMVAQKAVRNGGGSATSTGEKPWGGEGACTTGAKIGESGGLKAVVLNLTHGDGGRSMGWCQERGGGGGSHPIGGWRPAGSGPRPTGACGVARRDHATRSAEQGRRRGRLVGHSHSARWLCQLIRRPGHKVSGLNKSQINSNAPKLASVQTGPSLAAKI